MGFFKKIGQALVEEIPSESTPEVELPYYDENNTDVTLEEVRIDTLVDDIYEQNDLFDKSKSIFKVEEMINSLPKEMMTEVKKASVISILGSFGLTATEVAIDGDNRIKVLASVKDCINMDTNNAINEKIETIEKYKKSIADLELEITNAQNELKVSNESINNEIEKIETLIKFIGGAE